MSHLSIQLLGAFQAQLDGKPVTELKTDKTRALLSYLAVEAGTPYRRESLAALLWPDCSEEASSRSLRQALSQLNHALEITPAAPTFLTITRTSVAFNRDSDYDLDVTAFVDAILTSRQHRHRRLEVCQLCMRRLQDAVVLYRGEFLEGLIPHNSQPFEEWRSFQQEQYHQQALEALHALTCHHESRKEYAQAIVYARQQVALEPWREEAHRQLMRSLALNGQRSMAIAQYQACRRVLERELGIPPEDATQTLYTEIKSGRPAEEVLQIAFTPNNLPAQVTPFIGREEELHRIAERLSSLDCRLITLIGMGGNGKTRLALQAAEEALGTFQDGIYFIPLAPVKSADNLAPVILETLQTPPTEALPEEQLLTALRDKEVLLILDSFEHLTGNAPLLLRLLTRAPHLKLLVTSRERLNMQG
ncbi:MAG: BTAD domain-containing putative transcriptional regulator, partial [Anaerolineae bacterium]|nr:BTAD domain-containing putative transcriptional regulator [Anaerolineae bacterium]